MTSKKKKQIQELYKVFCQFDKNKNGVIDAEELKQLLTHFDHRPTEQNLQDLLQSINKNQN